MRRLAVSMGGRFGKYGDAKRKAQIPKNHLIEKDMFKNYARFARTFRSPSRNTGGHMISWEGLPFGSDLNISGFETIGRHQKSSYNGQDHRRKTWKQPSERKIYKVWHETYGRGEYFYNALTQGFYDGDLVPAFDTAIIDKKGRCRGYFMNECEKLTGAEKAEKRWVDVFLPLLIQRAKDTSYFYYDFHRSNVMKYNDKFCLIDLDSIYPLNEYEEWKNEKHKGGGFMRCSRYRDELERLIKGNPEQP